MNGRKLDVPPPDAGAHGVEDDAAMRRHARPDRAARLAAERDVDVAGRDAGIRSRDDVPGERAGELVVDASGGNDDPRARDGRQTRRPLHSSAAPAVPAPTARRNAASGRRASDENDATPHNGLLVHASESPEASEQEDDARRRRTPP